MSEVPAGTAVPSSNVAVASIWESTVVSGSIEPGVSYDTPKNAPPMRASETMVMAITLAEFFMSVFQFWK